MEENQIYTANHIDVEERISESGKKQKGERSSGRLFVACIVFFSLTFASLCAAIIYLDQKGIIPEAIFTKILIGAGLFVLLDILMVYASRKNKVIAFISIFICFLLIIVSCFGVYTLYKLYESMNAVEDPETYYASVGIYVKNGSVFAPASSETKAGKDKVTAAFSGDRLAGATVGTMILNLDKGYTSQAMRMFRKNTDVNVRTFEDFGSMVDALRNDEIDAILYNTAFLKMMLEDGDDFFEWAAEADRIYIETENTATVKKADVVSEPFIVYLAGLDTDDEDTFRQSGTERADANILVCVDPVKKKILLVNTPRDYYVPLWGRNNAMDKLTHSGVYGIDCSVSTLESFYDIDINYYVRTNVFSLVKIVDALGGITVHSDFEFFCANGIGGYHHFYVGDNEIDGAAALCFIREREQFEDGDRQRGIHQQECIRAIVEKACSPAIIAHFTDVLEAVKDAVRTNVNQEEINALVKMQLSDMASWSVESVAVDGYGAFRDCLALGQEAYVMIPYNDTVQTAKDMIREFLAR